MDVSALYIMAISFSMDIMFKDLGPIIKLQGDNLCIPVNMHVHVQLFLGPLSAFHYSTIYMNHCLLVMAIMVLL